MSLQRLYRVCRDGGRKGIPSGVKDFAIQGMGKHGMFREPNCMLFYLYNIIYHIMERFSLIRGCRQIPTK